MFNIFKKEKEKENPNANLVLDFSPNPMYQATYESDKERVVLRVDNYKGFGVGDFIGSIYWALHHESIHVAVYKICIADTPDKNEWYQVAGMDYLEGYRHDCRLTRPMGETYSKLYPNAFGFRKKFDINYF